MAIELPDGRCEPDDVLEALRLRAVHARQLGYALVARCQMIPVGFVPHDPGHLRRRLD